MPQAGNGWRAAVPMLHLISGFSTPSPKVKNFDPTGAYIRRWVPELAHLDDADVHAPWNVVTPPEYYPKRMVDHAAARQAALEALKKIKNSA